MMTNGHMENEGQKPKEELSSQVYVHKAKLFLSSYEGAGMDAHICQIEVFELRGKFGKILRNVMALIMEHKGNDIESRRNDRRIETS